jgi:integrase
MASMRRIKTSYPGVFYILGKSISTGKPEKIYYIRYRKNGKEIEEKAGRQFQDDMTPARAATKRAQRIEGELSNKEQRKAIKAETDKWTIGRLWDEYKAQKSTNSSFKQDKSRYKLYLKDKFSRKEPDKLIQLDIDRLRINLLKKKSPQTVKHVLSLLRRLINFGTNKGLCPAPAFKIEMPSVDNETTEDLNTDQIKKLLKAIEKDTHPQAGNMMLMALYSGMRRGEMFKLKWDDIDFRRGFITLRGPKGGTDQKIPLNDASRSLLGGINRTSDYVFPGRGGNQRTDINKAVTVIKTAAKLPKNFRPLHGLRHVYASMLASTGKVDMYTLQKLLTHKSSAMTQRYAHLRDDTLKGASDLASDIISQVENSIEEEKVVGLNGSRK